MYVGAKVGYSEGTDDGRAVGSGVGLPASYVGANVGYSEGTLLGDDVGRGVGEFAL